MLVLSSLVLYPLYSSDYYITEEQMTSLETILNSQKEMLQKQQIELIEAQKSMKNLNMELTQQKKYCEQLEKNNRLKIIKVAGISIGISVSVGILTGVLIGVNIK